MWFVEKIAGVLMEAEGETRTTFGRCRRHAPTMSGFPAVYGTDWCGDHKLDETKIAPPAPSKTFFEAVTGFPEYRT
jgi:hypothetical protein